jgi:hypothetical protein
LSDQQLTDVLLELINTLFKIADAGVLTASEREEENERSQTFHWQPCLPKDSVK